jgi:hypothetical protein
MIIHLNWPPHLSQKRDMEEIHGNSENFVAVPRLPKLSNKFFLSQVYNYYIINSRTCEKFLKTDPTLICLNVSRRRDTDEMRCLMIFV